MPLRPPVHSLLPHRPTQDRHEQDWAYELRRDRNPALRQAKRIRTSRRWKAFRRWFLGRYPLCRDPFGRHEEWRQVVPADHVHHILGLCDQPDLAFDVTNCAPLCTSCHARVEGMNRGRRATVNLLGVGPQSEELFKRYWSAVCRC